MEALNEIEGVLEAWDLVASNLCCRDGAQVFQMDEASRGGQGFMDRERARVADAALEAAEVRAFLDIGVPQFFAEQMSRASYCPGLRDVAGVNSDPGGGDECDEQFSQEGG
jgi:hypothetical protein